MTVFTKLPSNVVSCVSKCQRVLVRLIGCKEEKGTPVHVGTDGRAERQEKILLGGCTAWLPEGLGLWPWHSDTAWRLRHFATLQKQAPSHSSFLFLPFLCFLFFLFVLHTRFPEKLVNLVQLVAVLRGTIRFVRVLKADCIKDSTSRASAVQYISQ